MTNASNEPIAQESDESAGLTDRQESILRLIIHEYVKHGRPVGSKRLTESYPVGVSAATVRNSMADLETAGFVEHLHTSGGRVPTDAGYRYFVENLMQDSDLPDGEQIMIRHMFRQAESQLEDWPELAAEVLADIAGNVSVVTAPKSHTAMIRQVDLISLQPRLALLIVVTLESNVRQVLLHLPNETSRETLAMTANRISSQCHGWTGEQMASAEVGDSELDRLVRDQLAMTLRAIDATEQTSLRSSGIENMLGRTDLSDEAMQSLLDLLRGRELLSGLVPQLKPGPSVQVFIGDGNLPGALGRLGVIVATYGVGEEVNGLLGVLGPTRMSYWRTISTVRYMSRLVSDLVSDLYPGSDR